MDEYEYEHLKNMFKLDKRVFQNVVKKVHRAVYNKIYKGEGNVSKDVRWRVEVETVFKINNDLNAGIKEPVHMVFDDGE